MIEPEVSVPTVDAARPDDAADADPPDEPLGSPRVYGSSVWPPTFEKPCGAVSEILVAHSSMFVLPRTIAPAWRSRATRKAFRGGGVPSSALAPAVVGRSLVSMLSLIST